MAPQHGDSLAGSSSARAQIIGAWELVTCTARTEGSSDIVYPLGEDLQGIIMYTENGYMSAQLHRPGQPPFASPDMTQGTPEEFEKAGRSYIAYTGPFYVDESGEEPVLLHSMRHSSFPNWLGDTQRRLLRYTVEDGRKYMTLGPESAIPSLGAIRIVELKWRRLEDNQKAQPEL